MAGRVEGKVALITGAARGQGRAHAVALAREGADVIAVDICGPLPDIAYDSATREDLDETVRQVEALDRRIVPAVMDIRDLEGLRTATDQAVSQLGRLDIVVANAGICTPRAWDTLTPDVFANTMDINVTGTWNTIMAGAPHVVQAGGGSIVITSSVAGLKVQPFMVHYMTSKFAVRGMAKAFAAELARHRIRVNTVHPTGVNTPMGSGDMQAALGAAMGDDQRLGAAFMNLIDVQNTEPEDIANAVLYLVSDESRYVTGSELAVDAGNVIF